MNPLPPVVEPGPALTRDEITRYSRHLIIPGFGEDAQRRLKNARVLVIGAGGLGSPALLYLAAAGVGTLGIIDFDVVEESNLQRQVIHTQADIGRPKAVSARESVLALNPAVTVRLHEFRLDSSNAVDLFAEYDLIVDGADNFATRYLVNDAAALAHKPYVWGSIYRFSGQVAVFWEDAPDGRGLNLRDLYPEPPPPGLVPSCAEGGVLGVLCASVAAMMGTEAIKLITGTGESLLGRVMLYDALAMSYRSIRVGKDPAGAPITGLIDYEQFCGITATPEPGAEVTVTELHELRSGGEDFALIDVREPGEWAINRIEGAVLVPKSEFDAGGGRDRIPRDRRVVLYCKAGVRSAEVAAVLRAEGITDVRSLAGGIVAWAEQIDPEMVRY